MRSLDARVALAVVLFAVIAAPLFAQQPRLASDFEIAQMEKQLATARGFEAQLAGRLNLGDIRAARNELSVARVEYGRAYDLAERERRDARRDGSMSRYAYATSYAALAQAKLGRDTEAFALLEEAVRYASDDAEAWNLYASAMRVMGHPIKSVSAARNAVAIAARGAGKLDVAVYQHALATALIEAGLTNEAEEVLVALTESLRSKEFDALRRQVARQEAFEVYTSARGDVAAYVALLNRAQLRLGMLYEQRGAIERAREQYERVLAGRSDDVTALAALARLATSDAERELRYAEAFEANPFSLPLVREYQRHIASHPPRSIDDATTGGRIRTALVQLARGDARAARITLDALLRDFPANETLRTLRREADAPRAVTLPSETPSAEELRALADAFERLTPEQRPALDAMTFTSAVRFTGSEFEGGTIDGVPFRFSGPMRFQGTFDITAPLRLTYRILGVTRSGDSWALLLEPLRLEAAP